MRVELITGGWTTTGSRFPGMKPALAGSRALQRTRGRTRRVGIAGPASVPRAVTKRAHMSVFAFCAVLAACKDKEVDASEGAQQGDACDPAANAEAEEGEYCADGLACEPIDGGDGYVCGAALEIRGMVFDALSNAAIEGAH